MFTYEAALRHFPNRNGREDFEEQDEHQDEQRKGGQCHRNLRQRWDVADIWDKHGMRSSTDNNIPAFEPHTKNNTDGGNYCGIHWSRFEPVRGGKQYAEHAEGKHRPDNGFIGWRVEGGVRGQDKHSGK